MLWRFRRSAARLLQPLRLQRAVALILRAADRIAVPWKNGGGLTREVAVHPPGSDLVSFDWRVSLAEVREGGPFSIFPRIDRHLAVLSGRLELSVAGAPPVILSPASAPYEFPGDVPAAAEPLQPPVHDLNVMTRRGRFAAALRRCQVGAATIPRLEADAALLLALAPLTVHAGPSAASLGALDALWLSGIDHPRSVSSTGAEAAFWLIEISPAVNAAS